MPTRSRLELADLAMPAPFDGYHYTDSGERDGRALREWCDEVSSR